MYHGCADTPEVWQITAARIEEVCPARVMYHLRILHRYIRGTRVEVNLLAIRECPK
jgi:hypothetical protein